MTQIDSSPSYPSLSSPPATVVPSNGVRNIAIPRAVSSLFTLSPKEGAAFRFVYSKSVTLPSGVSRSFAEFSALRDALIAETDGCALVPRLPSRSPAGVFAVNVVKPDDDSAEVARTEPLDAALVVDLEHWLNFVSQAPALCNSATLKAFVSNAPFSSVATQARESARHSFAAKKKELPQLSKADRMRLFVHSIVREFKLTDSGAPSSLAAPSTEAALAAHKQLASHMLSNAKLLLANATNAVNHRHDVSDDERKLAAHVRLITHKSEPADAAAVVELSDAAAEFSVQQSAAASIDRKEAQQAEKQLAQLRLWHNVAHGYADTVARLTAARNNASFIEPLMGGAKHGETATATAKTAKRTEALDAHLKLEVSQADAIAAALDAAKDELLATRVRILKQWMATNNNSN
jgi:hypothetical protein